MVAVERSRDGGLLSQLPFALNGVLGLGGVSDTPGCKL